MKEASNFMEFAASITDRIHYEHGDLPRTDKEKYGRKIAQELVYVKSLRRYVESFLPRGYDLEVTEYQLADKSFWINFLAHIYTGCWVGCLVALTAIATCDSMFGIFDDLEKKLGADAPIMGIMGWALVVVMFCCAFSVTLSTLHSQPTMLFFRSQSNFEKVRETRRELQKKAEELNVCLEQVEPFREQFWQWEYFLKETLNARVCLCTYTPYIWNVQLHYRGRIGEPRMETYDLSDDGYINFVDTIMELCHRRNTGLDDIAKFEEEMLGKHSI